MVWTALIAGLVVGGALTIAFWDVVTFKIAERQVESFGLFSGDVVTFTPSQIEMIRTNYNAPRRFELAYCGIVDSNGRVRKLYVADIRTSSEEDVIFSCPSFANLFLHTHPLGSPPLLSTQDEKEFLSSDQEVSCVYASGAMGCYGKENGKLLKLKVVVR
jgi:hypothetical protein